MEILDQTPTGSHVGKFEPVRIGIVGCGAITDIGHLPAALRSPTVNVCALVDKTTENAARLARKYALRDCTIADNLDAVAGKVEAVLIATPNQSHFSIAQGLLARRIPILVEKPLTTTYAEAIALCELAEKERTFISVGYVTRYYPSVRLLKHLLETQYLGKLISFQYEFGGKGGWETASGYNLDRRAAGGGVLMVQGTHFIDRMLYLFGPPLSLSYCDDSYGGVEANCKAKMEWKSSAGAFSGTFFISKTQRLKNRLRIETDEYTCYAGEQEAESLTLIHKRQPEVRLEASPQKQEAGQPSRSYFQVQIEEFAGLVRRGGKPTVDGRFAAQSVKLIEEMYGARTQLELPWLLYRSKIEEKLTSNVQA